MYSQVCIIINDVIKPVVMTIILGQEKINYRVLLLSDQNKFNLKGFITAGVNSPIM